MSITVERLQAHVEVTGTGAAEKELLAFKAKSDRIIKSVGQNVTIGFDIKSGGLRDRIKAEVAAAQRGVNDVTVHIRTDTDSKFKMPKGVITSESMLPPMGGGRSGVDDLQTKAQRLVDTNHRVASSSRKSGDGFEAMWSKAKKAAAAMGLLAVATAAVKIPALATAAVTAVTGLQALGGGVVALLGPVASLSGLLGGIPSGLLAIGAVAGSVALGLSGVLAAVKAGAKDDGTAQKNKLALRDSLNALAEAEWSLARAQEGSTDAQKAINKARKEAQRNLTDMRFASASAALGEEAAVQSLTAARKELAKLNGQLAKDNAEYNRVTDEFTGRTYDIAKVTADETDLQDQRAAAILRVKEAELSLSQASEARKRTASDLAEAERKGIDHADNVVAANRAARDAAHSLAGALIALQKAQEAQTESAKNSAFGNEEYRKAMAKLSPEGRKFVDLYNSELKPLFDEAKKNAQVGLLPGLTDGTNNAMPMLKMLSGEMRNVGEVVGDVTRKGGEMVGSAGWLADLRTLLSRNNIMIGEFGDSLLWIVDSLKNVAISGKPVTDWLGDISTRWSTQMNQWSVDGRNDGSLESFFQRAVDTADKLFDTTGRLYGALKGVVKAAEPLGTSILVGWQRGATALERMATSAKAQEKMGKWFEDQREPLSAIWQLAKDIAIAFGGLDNQGTFLAIVSALRTDLLPSLVKAIRELSSSTFGVELVHTLSKLIDLFGTLASTSGPLMAAVTAIGAVAEALNAVLEAIPQLNQALSIGLTYKAGVGLASGLGLMGSKASGGGGLVPAGGMPNDKNIMPMGLGGIGGAGAAKSVATGAVVGAVMAIRVKQAWDKAASAAKQYKLSVSDALSSGDVDGALRKIKQFEPTYDAASAAVDRFQKKDAASQYGTGVVETVKAILGMKNIMDDAQNAAAGEEARASLDAYRSHVDMVASAFGVTKTAAGDMITAAGIDPTKMGYGEMLDALTQAKAGFLDAETAANRAKSASQDFFKTGKASMLSGAIDRSQLQSQFDALDPSKLTKGGKFDLGGEQSGQLQSLVEQYLNSQWESLVQKYQEHRISAAQFRAGAALIQQDMMNQIAKAFTDSSGNLNKSAMDQFIRDNGITALADRLLKYDGDKKNGSDAAELVKAHKAEIDGLLQSVNKDGTLDPGKALQAYMISVQEFGRGSSEAKDALAKYVKATEDQARKNADLMTSEKDKKVAMDVARTALMKQLEALGLTKDEAQRYIDTTVQWPDTLSTKATLTIITDMSKGDRRIIDWMIDHEGKAVPKDKGAGIKPDFSGGAGATEDSPWMKPPSWDAFGFGAFSNSKSKDETPSGPASLDGQAAPVKHVTMHNTFTKEQDPMHTAAEIAWQL